MVKYSLSVAADRLGKLIGHSPTKGLNELIWNALDADADLVQVETIANAAGGVEAVVVRDNGTGISPLSAQTDFGQLGGSWKQTDRLTKKHKRNVHGSNGQGRFAAFALGGNEVRWQAVAETDGHRHSTVVRISRDAPAVVEIDSTDAADAPIGTTVTVGGISSDPKDALGQRGLDSVTAEFALYLQTYRAVQLEVMGHRIDPADVISRHATIPLDVATARGDARLEIVEWSKRTTARHLHLCDERGMTLGQTHVGIQAPAYDFTAYILWPGFKELEADIGLEDLNHPELSPVVEAGRKALRAYFRQRDVERTEKIVEEWRSEGSYPYVAEATSDTERVERELFEVVAVTASSAVNAPGSTAANRRFSLSLISTALAADPDAVRNVMRHVLKLPKEQLALLDDLLKRTSLMNVVKTARMIYDRLAFLNDLEDLVHQAEAKTLLTERQQLHRIVEQEPWIFGEQFAVARSDRSLTECLKTYRLILGTVETTEDPVLLDGRQQIVDLLLWRQIPTTEKKRQFLVVELKRPAVKVGREELGQLEDYARAVRQDGRFSDTDVNWQFLLVSGDVKDELDDRRHSTDRAVGHVTKAKDHDIWVLTWAQVIADARYRMRFVEESLAMEAKTESPLSYVREKYGSLLPPKLRGDIAVSEPPARPDPRKSRRGKGDHAMAATS
jgi:hypothetical protein